MTAIHPLPLASDKKHSTTRFGAVVDSSNAQSHASLIMPGDPWTAIIRALTRIQRERQMRK